MTVFNHREFAAECRRHARTNRIFGIVLLAMSAVFIAFFFVFVVVTGIWNVVPIASVAVTVVIVSGLSLFRSARAEESTARSFERMSREVAS